MIVYQPAPFHAQDLGGILGGHPAVVDRAVGGAEAAELVCDLLEMRNQRIEERLEIVRRHQTSCDLPGICICATLAGSCERRLELLTSTREGAHPSTGVQKARH